MCQIQQWNHIINLFTISSELSNFHPCYINIDDHVFNCVKQYICYRKAQLYDTAEEILSMNNPIDMKKRVNDMICVYSYEASGPCAITIDCAT